MFGDIKTLQPFSQVPAPTASGRTALSISDCELCRTFDQALALVTGIF